MENAEKRLHQATDHVIRLFYGFQFFFSLLLWVPIFYDFQKRIGLDDSEIFGIQSIYYLVFCLLEIPTGMLADRWGHRVCMRAGALVLVVCNLLPTFAQSYWGMLAHFLLIALSRSLISGAASAYLYDFLRICGASDRYKKVEGNARAYSLIGKVVCWAGVGALMEFHLTLPYWLTVLSSAISVGFAWRLPVLALPAKAEAHQRNILPDLAPVLGILRRTPVLLLIMLQGISVFVLARILQVNLFQPLLQVKGFSVASYGAVMSLMTFFEAGGSMMTVRGKRLSDWSLVFILTLLIAVSLFLADFSTTVPGVLAALTLFSFCTGLVYPVQRQLMNDAIPDSRYRATLLSMESILDRGFSAWAAIYIADFVSRGAVGEYLRISGGITAGAMIVLFVGARWLIGRKPSPCGVEGTPAS